MEILRIEILHPKVKWLIKDLASLDLISIREKEDVRKAFQNLLDRLRLKSDAAPSLEEITKCLSPLLSGHFARRDLGSFC